MSQDLHKLTVSIEAQISKFKSACREVKKEASDAAGSANKSLNSINDKGAANAAQKTLDKMKRLQQMMKEFGVKAKLDAGLIAPTQRAAELQARLEQANGVIEETKAMLDDLGDSSIGTDWYVELTDRLADAKIEAANLTAEIQRLGVSGSFANVSPPSFIGDMKAYADEARRAMAEFNEQFRAGFRMTAPPGLMAFMQKMNDIRVGIKDAGSDVKRFAVGVKNDIMSAAQAVGNFVSKIPLIGRIRGHTNSASAGFRQMRRSILNTALALAGAYFGINAVRQGLANLEQYSGRTRSDLAMLRSSLETCRNALATAFAPVLSVVAPILSAFIDWVTAAATALAHFIAALTGQSMVVVARKAGSTVASGMSDAAGATNDANDAAKEYQRTLMGFDQINKLNDNSGSGGSGGSGGGGVGGGGVGDMFETVTVGDTFKEWADRFKEAWANADFTEIGEIVATKLNGMLANIPWEAIQETCNKVAKSIGTFINGFVDKFDWGLLAKTVSLGIETAMDTVSTLIETINWQNIGAAIVKFICGIDYAGLFSSGFRLLGGVTGGIAGIIAGAINECMPSIKDYFNDSIEAAGGDIVKGIFNGIVNAIKDVAKFIKENIFDPFVEGFKKAFGISSPSTEMEPYGENIVFGILEGAKNVVTDLIDWFSNLPKTILDKMGDIGITVFVEALEWATNIPKTIGGFVASFAEWVKGNGFVSTIGDMIANFFSWKKGDGFSPLMTMKAVFKTFKNEINKKKRALGGFKSIISKFSDNIKNKVLKNFTASITHYSSSGNKHGGSSGKFAGGGIFYGGSWHPITAAANGGEFIGGQAFIARESGPELVGTIGGHTAVMNNDQIVASVAAGVAKAVAATMGTNRGGQAVNVTLEGDAKKLFKVIVKEANNYTNSTGLSPFPV